jgi:hypothetical protein
VIFLKREGFVDLLIGLFGKDVDLLIRLFGYLENLGVELLAGNE